MEINSLFKSDEDKEALLNMLRGGIVGIVFLKADGSERKLVGTLDDNLFDYEFAGTTKILPQDKNDALADSFKVWDLENDGWRMIYYDKILSIKINTEGEKPT